MAVWRIANYFLWFFQTHGDLLTNLKLQKLLYFAQGWYLALYDEKLFKEDIQAWIHGPVVPTIYHHYREYKYAPITKRKKKPELEPRTIKHLNDIIVVYGALDSYGLENLATQSDPWRKARNYIPMDAVCVNVISTDEMTLYFQTKKRESLCGKVLKK